MRAFITGGTGFIGSNLVAGLNDYGIISRVLRRETSSTLALEGLNYETSIGDILDSPDQLAEAISGCDWVFHIAAVSDYWRKGSDWIYEVNVQGTNNMLAAAKKAGTKRFIFTSSLAALGMPEPGQLLDESSSFNLNPEHWPYGHSKHLAEIEVVRAVENGLKAIILNPSIVLGPRDVNLISGSIIIEAAKGLARVYPPGGVNYVSIEDVVAGHIGAAEKGIAGERYVLAGENVSHKKALQIICEVVGRPPPKIRIPKKTLPIISATIKVLRAVFGNRIPFDANQVLASGEWIYADGRKAINAFNLPQVPFNYSVQNTYDWFSDHGFLDH